MKKGTKILAIILICVLCIGVGAAAALIIRREIRDELDYGEKGNNSVNSSQNENNPPTDNPQSSTTNNNEQQPQPQQSQPQPQTGNTTPDNSSYIGEERAKEIALSDAGVSADGVYFEKVKLERDDGVWQYEVEFRQGRTEYDYDIKADDGTVISRDVDYDD